METWIKTEDNENTWEYLQQVMNCDSKFENDLKQQSMFVTFSTKLNTRKVYNTHQEKVEVKSFSPDTIVKVTLDPKLRMTPFVKLEKLKDNPVVSNNFLNMPRKYSRKSTKSVNSEQNLKPPKNKRTVDQSKTRTIVQEINLQNYKNCLENTYSEKPLDTVTAYQIKGNFNSKSQTCDLYPNDCYRATSRNDLTCNDVTTKNLMQSDFENLWQKQEEEASMCDPSNDLPSELFSGTRTRRLTRQLSSSSKSDSLENISKIANNFKSPKVNKTKKSAQVTPEKTESNNIQENYFVSILSSPEVNTIKKRKKQLINPGKSKLKCSENTIKQINDTFKETKFLNESTKIAENNLNQNSISLRRKDIHGQRKLKKKNSPSKKVINTPNDSTTSLKNSPKESEDILIGENESQAVPRKPKLIEEFNNSLKSKITQFSTELDSNSENESVLSNCKIFSRLSDTSSEFSAPKSNKKVRLTRSICSTKFLRKKNTKSNIFLEVIPRITSDHSLFNQSSVLAEEDIDLENLTAVNNQPQNFQITVHNDSRNFVHEPLKTQFPSNEKLTKRITDLRDIISPKSVSQDFKVKRPPNSKRSLSINSCNKQPTNNFTPSFMSNSSSSFLTPPGFHQTNYQPVEDDVISLFADSHIGNNSPRSDLDDSDDDNKFSQNYSNFSTYDIDERASSGNCTITGSDVNRNDYLDNSLKTNSLESKKELKSYFSNGNTSPISDLDDCVDNKFSDDDNNFSKNYSNFSALDIDERVSNGNCTVTKSDFNRNNYLDNSLKTNSVESNIFQTKLSPLDSFPKITKSQNSFKKKNYLSERDNSLCHTETTSTFVPSSTNYNNIDNVSADLLHNGNNMGFELNYPELSSPTKITQISQDTLFALNDKKSVKSNSLSYESTSTFSTFKPVEIDKNDSTDLNNFTSNVFLSPNKRQCSEIMKNVMKTNESTINNYKNIEKSPENRSPQLSPRPNVIKNNIISQTKNIMESPSVSGSNTLESFDNIEKTDDEFRAFFRGTVCFHFLYYGFCGQIHSLKHEIPKEYDKVLEKLSPSQISLTYNTFVCEYSFLLEKTIPTFAKYFGKYEDEKNLIDMVRQLQKLKSSIKPKVKVSCMKSILDALNDFMECHVAIDKIFENIARKDVSTIDILLEILLDEPSIENNWSLIKKLTSVEDYEIPLKVVELILNDCCNRSKIRKFHVKNVFNDVIAKIADVNLLKIESQCLDNFVKIMENLELNCVNEFKNRLITCKNRPNDILKNDSVFKVPAPVIKKTIATSSSYITTTLDTNMENLNVTPTPPNSDNLAFLGNSNDGDRYSPTASTSFNTHEKYKPRSKTMHFHGKNIYANNKRKQSHYEIKNIVKALRNGDFKKGLEKLRFFSRRSNFHQIVNSVAKQLSPQMAECLLKSFCNTGYNSKDLNRYNYHE